MGTSLHDFLLLFLLFSPVHSTFDRFSSNHQDQRQSMNFFVLFWKRKKKKVVQELPMKRQRQY